MLNLLIKIFVYCSVSLRTISPKVLEWRYYPCPGKCRLGSIRREVKDSALELGTWMGLNCKGTIVEYWIYRVRASPAPKLIWCQTLESLRAFKNDSTCLTDPRFRDEKGNIGYKCGILVILAAHKRTWSRVLSLLRQDNKRYKFPFFHHLTKNDRNSY